MNTLHKIFHNWKRLLFWKKLIILSLILAGSVYAFSGASSEQPVTNIQEYVVTRGDIRTSIQTSGQAELVDEQKLRFNQTGKVVTVNVSNGDTVVKDQIIAELDQTELENEIKQAQISLNNSNITLRDLLDGNDELIIQKSRNTLTNTEKQVEVSRKNILIQRQQYQQNLADLDTELELAKKDYENKENDLLAAQKKYDTTIASEEESVGSTETSFYSSLKNATLDVKDILISIQNDLSDINDFMGFEGQAEFYNDDYEMNISALSSKYKSETERSYYAVQNALTTLTELYQTTQSTDLSKDSVLALLQNSSEVLIQAESLADNYYGAVSNTTSGASLSESTLNSQKSSASSLVQGVKNMQDSMASTTTSIKNLSSLSTSQLSSDTTLIQGKNTLESAKYSLAKSKQSYETLSANYESNKKSALITLQKAENELSNLLNTLEEQKADLADLEDGADEDDIAKARNDVLQKQLSLEKVKSNIDKYQIIAPFNGVVRTIDYKTGDNILSDDDKYVYIENPNLLQVKISLDQIDIVKVDEGMKANITFDALPTQTFEGVIDEVDETPVSSSGVVSYTVSITLNKGEERIYSGMTAEVNIVLKEALDVVTLPSSAIKSRGNKHTIQIKENAGIIPKEIEIGMSDGSTTEVINGLQEGDIVIETKLARSNTSAPNASKAQQGNWQPSPERAATRMLR